MHLHSGDHVQGDSRIAGEILGITPETYRQRLSRVRKKMAEFLENYCGEYGQGKCKCKNRVNYAIQTHRLQPQNLAFTSSKEIVLDVKNAMEEVDDLAGKFDFCKTYAPPETLHQFVKDFLQSTQISTIQSAGLEEM